MERGKKEYFEAPIVCSEKSIVSINELGINVDAFGVIDFAECANNFYQTHGGSGNCVGERDIASLSFTFYTAAKPTMIKFLSKNKFLELLSKDNTRSRFHRLQQQIAEYGYSTYDMA